MPHEKQARNPIFGYKEQRVGRYGKENNNFVLRWCSELVESFQTNVEDIEGHRETIGHVMQSHSIAPLDSSSSNIILSGSAPSFLLEGLAYLESQSSI